MVDLSLDALVSTSPKHHRASDEVTAKGERLRAVGPLDRDLFDEISDELQWFTKNYRRGPCGLLCDREMRAPSDCERRRWDSPPQGGERSKSDPIIVPVPFYEVTHSLLYLGLWTIVKLLNELRYIGESVWHVSGLHGEKIQLCFAACDPLDQVDVGHQRHLLLTPDVVYPPWRSAGVSRRFSSIPVGIGLSRAVEYPDHPFDDVVDIGEVSARLSMSKDVDGLSREDPLCEEEYGHVGPSPRPIDGEEAQSCGGEVEEVAVGVGHQFI